MNISRSSINLAETLTAVLSVVSSLLLVTGCGGTDTSPDSSPAPVFPEVDVWLAITDSIGIEMGDSNLVLGNPVAACRMPGNRTAVLDMQKCSVSFFSPEEGFITSVGRQGSGPGEFLMPSSLSPMPSGGFAVSDAMAGGLKFFNSEYEYTGELTGFFPAPPAGSIFLDDSTFVGMMVDYNTDGDEMLAGFKVALWTTGSIESEVTFFSDLAPLDLMDIANSEAGIPIFTASPEGMVYTTAQTTEEFVFQGWNTDGTELFTVCEPYEKVRKTQEEMDIEWEHTQNLLSQGGMPQSMIESFRPDEFKFAITSLGIAPDGNLWVGLGAYGHPVFRVYDPHDGEYLFTAALEHPENPRNLNVMMNGLGFTAVDPLSESWPRVYLINPVN